MEISIRKNEKFVDVQIEEGSAKIDMGLLDEDEAGEFIQTLLDAASELTYAYQRRYEITEKAVDTALDVFAREKTK